MFKNLIIVCGVILTCGILFMVSGCKEGIASLGKSEYKVGEDIAITEVKDFYHTVSASTNPPEFQRYRFTSKDGKHYFYHEKREGDVWPLTEKHITVSGTIELSDKEWNEFFDYIKGGKVTKRVDDPRGGGRGPWLYLYWTKDKDKYQVFKFEKYAKQKGFEDLCLKLKETK